MSDLVPVNPSRYLTGHQCYFYRRIGNRTRCANEWSFDSWGVTLIDDGTLANWTGWSEDPWPRPIVDRHICTFTGYGRGNDMIATGLVHLHPDKTFTGVSWLYEHPVRPPQLPTITDEMVEKYLTRGYVTVEGRLIMNFKVALRETYRAMAEEEGKGE